MNPRFSFESEINRLQLTLRHEDRGANGGPILAALRLDFQRNGSFALAVKAQTDSEKLWQTAAQQALG